MTYLLATRLSRACRAVGIATALSAWLLGAGTAASRAQDQRTGAMPATPSVLLYPAYVAGADDKPLAEVPAGARQAQEAATEAVRKYLARSGVSVVVYDRRLPSVQRAVSEGTIKAEAAAAGPRDDERNAQQLAEIVGASEYITTTVQDYKFDPATRTATFNLSLYRKMASDASPTGTAAAPANGVAPADVAAPRQEGSATARAAEAAADQAVQGLYPRPPVETPKQEARRSGRGERYILPAFGVALGLLILSSR